MVKYLKKYKTFESVNGYYEVEMFTLELDDILQELKDEGYIVNVDPIEWIDDYGISLEGFYIDIRTYKEEVRNKDFLRDVFSYGDIKHIIDQLISFSNNSGYVLSSFSGKLYSRKDTSIVPDLSINNISERNLKTKLDIMQLKFSIFSTS